jgi:ABC-type Fe3+-hydroxamate transport system substrate-binding protein
VDKPTRFVGQDDQKNIDELVAAGIQVDKELIAQLRAENEALREAFAKHIYAGWSDDPSYVPWVSGGNSLKQDEARRLASDAMRKEASHE